LICGGSVRGVAILAPPVAGLFTALVMSAATAQLNCNPGIEFYAEGPIKACNLNGNHRLYTVRGDVVVCADGHPLVQFPDGRLQSCTVAEPSVIAGERCDASSRVVLASDGALESCRKS
jgi:hypothetical protein